MQLKTTTLITLALLLNGCAARSEKLPEDLEKWQVGVTYSYYQPIWLDKAYGVNHKYNWSIEFGPPSVFFKNRGLTYKDYPISKNEEKLFNPLMGGQEDGFSLYDIKNRNVYF